MGYPTTTQDSLPVAGQALPDGLLTGGMTLMPGLIDGHTHLNYTGVFQSFGGAENAHWEEIGASAVANARDYLEDGYTTIRDMGGMATSLKSLVDRGVLEGPRIYPSATPLSQTSGHADWRSPIQRLPGGPMSSATLLGLGLNVDGVDEVIKGSRRSLSLGATQLKICTGGGIFRAVLRWRSWARSANL